MSEPVLVLGDDPLARALRAASPRTMSPLTLVTDPSRLPEALAGGSRQVALTAWSAGGYRASRELGLPPTVATFGSLLPLGSGGPTDIGLPASLAEAARERMRVSLTEALGEVVEVAEGPGLVRGRILACLVNEAAHLLGEGQAQAKDIDRAMVLGMNQPRGPLAWADLIGLDVVERLLLELAREYGAEVYRPAPALSRRVMAGQTGQAAGEGFFQYGADGGVEP